MGNSRIQLKSIFQGRRFQTNLGLKYVMSKVKCKPSVRLGHDNSREKKLLFDVVLSKSSLTVWIGLSISRLHCSQHANERFRN